MYITVLKILLPDICGQCALFNKSEPLCERAEPVFSNHRESYTYLVLSTLKTNSGRMSPYKPSTKPYFLFEKSKLSW